MSSLFANLGRGRLVTTFIAATLMCGTSLSPVRADDTKTLNVIDDRGVAVSLPASAKRIASVSYFAAHVALALGIKPAATTYMVEGRNPDFLGGYLDGVKQIGQRATPNLELLAEARPDVTVAIRRYTEGNAAQYQKVAPYLAYGLELYADSDRTIAQLSTILGRPERGLELNKTFKADLETFAAKATRDIHPRFVVMWGGETPWVFRSENMTAAILVALGGDNIGGQNPTPSIPDNWGLEMSLETMLEKDPVVMFRTGRRKITRIAVVLAIHDLNHAMAVADRVFLLSGGRTIFEGKSAELASTGHLQSVFKVGGVFETVDDGEVHFRVPLSNSRTSMF